MVVCFGYWVLGLCVFGWVFVVVVSLFGGLWCFDGVELLFVGVCVLFWLWRLCLVLWGVLFFGFWWWCGCVVFGVCSFDYFICL